jgi:hypothetical protein
VLLTAQRKLPFWVIQKCLHCLLFQSKKLMIVHGVMAGIMLFCSVILLSDVHVNVHKFLYQVCFLMELGWKPVRIMLSARVEYVEHFSCSYLLFGKFSCVTWYRVKFTSLPGAEHSLNPHFTFISWKMWHYHSILTAWARVSAVVSYDNWRLPHPTYKIYCCVSQPWSSFIRN